MPLVPSHCFPVPRCLLTDNFVQLKFHNESAQVSRPTGPDDGWCTLGLAAFAPCRDDGLQGGPDGVSASREK